MTLLELGDRARAAMLVSAGLERVTDEGWHFSVVRLLHLQALLRFQTGDFAEAERLLADALTSARSFGDLPGTVDSLTLLGTVAARQGYQQHAATALAEALDIAQTRGTRLLLARALQTLAGVVVETHPVASVRFTVAAENLRDALLLVPLPTEGEQSARYQQKAIRRLGQRGYDATRKVARTLTIEAAIAEGRELTRLILVNGSGAGPARKGSLSSREREVAALVTSGLTNREIADELSVTQKTAEVHVSHILNKLGLSSRVEIATWGVRQGWRESAITHLIGDSPNAHAKAHA